MNLLETMSARFDQDDRLVQYVGYVYASNISPCAVLMGMTDSKWLEVVKNGPTAKEAEKMENLLGCSPSEISFKITLLDEDTRDTRTIYEW